MNACLIDGNRIVRKEITRSWITLREMRWLSVWSEVPEEITIEGGLDEHAVLDAIVLSCFRQRHRPGREKMTTNNKYIDQGLAESRNIKYQKPQTTV